MKKIRILDGYHLKLIAIITMFLDHFSAVILADWANNSARIPEEIYGSHNLTDRILIFGNEHQELLWFLTDKLRWIGRWAFPIFCFLLVEGFLHTKNRKQYASRLLLFGIISEIPFDLCFNDGLIEFSSNNVMITLFCGFMTIWGLDLLASHMKNLREKGVPSFIVTMAYGGLATIITLLLSHVMIEFICSDYHASGLVAIVLIYLLRKCRLLGYALGMLSLLLMNFSPMQIFAFPSLIPVAMYNNKRGKSRKFFFYIFYPAHLVVLLTIREIVGIG